MDMPTKTGNVKEKRRWQRFTGLSNPMAEVKLLGSPIFQLKILDLSEKGASIVVRPDSSFLKVIEVGHEVNVRLVLPKDYRGPSGQYRSKIEHITETQESPFRGHMVVGLFFISRFSSV